MEHTTELCQAEIKTCIARMPTFELSYEIFKHNTTPPPQLSPEEWLIHIPVGHKWFAWFSFYGKKNGIFWMELNRTRAIQRVFFQPTTVPDDSLFYGTIFYGTRIVLPHKTDATETVWGSFVIEDVFYYRGNFVHCFTELEKWTILFQFLQKHSATTGFKIPHIGGEPNDRPPYSTHHIQIRHLTKICPFTNWSIPKSNTHSNSMPPSTRAVGEILKPAFKNWKKEQYQMDTVFSVQADLADDMYKLYVFGPQRSLLFYDFCMVPDYETSKQMNALFRRVRENICLDWIEESDDEEETPPTDKHLLITCRFHSKFRKWIPLQVAPRGARVAHICQL